MQALVLAAGDGDRLHPLTLTAPKPLVPLLGRPIITHVFDALFSAGVTQAVVVIGYRGADLRTALEASSRYRSRLTFVENPKFSLGNARSLWAARDVVGDRFLLTMADHVLEPAL